MALGLKSSISSSSGKLQTPHGYKFAGNRPIAWWDSTYGVTYDGSNKVSSWKSRFPSGTRDDWELTQSTGVRQPTYDASNSSFNDLPSLEFNASSAFTALVGGAATNVHITNPVILVAAHNSSLSHDRYLVAQFGGTDYQTDKDWILFALNTGSPKDARSIWATTTASNYFEYITLSPVTTTSGTSAVYAWRSGTVATTPTQWWRDKTATEGSATTRPTGVTYNFEMGGLTNFTNREWDGYILECILFDADSTAFTNAEILTLSEQMAARYDIPTEHDP